MKAYDKLPPSVRAALANANLCWAPQPFLTEWRKGEHTGPEIARAIATIDARDTRLELRKVWGANYPGALPAPCRRRRR